MCQVTLSCSLNMWVSLLTAGSAAPNKLANQLGETLSAVISLLELKSLATTRSFARGEAYFKEGRVHGLAGA